MSGEILPGNLPSILTKTVESVVINMWTYEKNTMWFQCSLRGLGYASKSDCVAKVKRVKKVELFSSRSKIFKGRKQRIKRKDSCSQWGVFASGTLWGLMLMPVLFSSP